ncbi:MAG: TIGR01777 family oxidoreductase [Bacteroidota bacterium]|nr:TIGR01777 family oxidoreductase [Bacteroidota bacterium]
MKQSVVLITGGTGLVGRALISLLSDSGYRVRILTRGKRGLENAEAFRWDVDSGHVEADAVEGVDHIIHLAGENIGKGRWTKSRKKTIVASRTRSARLLYDTIEKRNPGLRSFTSASATGYYGSVTSDRIFNEKDPPGDDFLAKVCVQWEEAAGMFRSGGYRTTIVRTGVVLSKKGGMLKRIMPTINMHFSPLFGNGKQYIPWIHIDDLCGIYRKILDDNNIDGVYNAVAPDHVSYKDFIRTLSSVKKQKILMPPTPELPWKILFGEKSSILLEGSRVSSKKIINTGYEFKYPELKQALDRLLKS